LVLEELGVDFRIKEAVFFSRIHLARRERFPHLEDGRCKGNSKIPWREAGPPNRLDDKVDSDQ